MSAQTVPRTKWKIHAKIFQVCHQKDVIIIIAILQAPGAIEYRYLLLRSDAGAVSESKCRINA